MNKPEYTEKEQQALEVVSDSLDSLPGYRKYYIYFNGKIVGYKYEKVQEGKSIGFRRFLQLREMFGF